VAEFLRYVAVGWMVSAINYGVFVAILLVQPTTEPLVALLASSIVAMFFAYFGMRFAAFRIDAQAPQRD
jgi:putative flippase GtrA